MKQPKRDYDLKAGNDRARKIYSRILKEKKDGKKEPQTTDKVG